VVHLEAEEDFLVGALIPGEVVDCRAEEDFRGVAEAD
jgi:hypothetical protein